MVDFGSGVDTHHSASVFDAFFDTPDAECICPFSTSRGSQTTVEIFGS